MKTGKIKEILKRMSGVYLVSFLIILLLSLFLISEIVISRVKIEELLTGHHPVNNWYVFPENIAAVIAGLFICFMSLKVLRDNFNLKKLNSVFENLAKTDVLTGIYNRRYLEEALNKVIKTISRCNNNLSLIMVDVDFFKNYNDNYGHNSGDLCLKIIAEVLAGSVSREDDFAARFGGEEFVVVLPFTNEEGVRVVAARMLENIRKRNIPHVTSETGKIVTFSIGCTTGNVKHTHSGIDYIKRADQALYISKQNGRNRYSFLSFESPQE